MACRPIRKFGAGFGLAIRSTSSASGSSNRGAIARHRFANAAVDTQIPLSMGIRLGQRSIARRRSLRL